MAEVPDSEPLREDDVVTVGAAEADAPAAEAAAVTAPSPVPLPEGRAPDDNRVLEALLFSAGEPLTVSRLLEITGWDRESLLAGVAALNREYREQGRAFTAEEVAGGYLIFTLPAYGGWVRRLKKKEEEGQLTPAAMETLAIVAYRQPITRAEIDAVRGVQCSAVLGSLLDRRLVRIAGRSEALGHPLLYGTTREFLKQFGLAGLKDLPKVEEFKELAAVPPPAPEGSPDAELSAVPEGPPATVPVDVASVPSADPSAGEREITVSDPEDRSQKSRAAGMPSDAQGG